MSPAGADTVRFKAEVNFDGREVARAHVSRLDLETVLKVKLHTLQSQKMTFKPPHRVFFLYIGDAVIFNVG